MIDVIEVCFYLIFKDDYRYKDVLAVPRKDERVVLDGYNCIVTEVIHQVDGGYIQVDLKEI